MMVITFSAEIDKIQSALNTLIIAAVSVRCILILTQSRNDDQPLAIALQKCKKIILAGMIAITLKDMIDIIQSYFLMGNTGSGIEGASIFVGGLQLLEAIISAFIALDIAWTVIDVIKGIFCYIKGNPEEKEMQLQQIKKSLLIGILILCVFGLVKVIFSYFGG